MKEEFIKFRTAQLAKKKGFWLYGGTNENYIWTNFTRPSQSILQKWLREVYEIIVEPLTFDKGWLERGKWCYQYHIHNKTDNPNEHYISKKEYKTWENALEDGLLQGLKLIK